MIAFFFWIEEIKNLNIGIKIYLFAWFQVLCSCEMDRKYSRDFERFAFGGTDDGSRKNQTYRFNRLHYRFTIPSFKLSIHINGCSFLRCKYFMILLRFNFRPIPSYLQYRKSILKDDLQVVLLKVNCNLCLMSVKLYIQLRLNNLTLFNLYFWSNCVPPIFHLNNNWLKYL